MEQEMINGITLINEKAYYVNGKLETSAPFGASNKKILSFVKYSASGCW